LIPASLEEEGGMTTVESGLRADSEAKEGEAEEAAAVSAGGTWPSTSSTESYQQQQQQQQGNVAAAAAALARKSSPAGGQPSSSWRHIGLLWLACCLTIGAYYSKDVIAAVSPEVRTWGL